MTPERKKYRSYLAGGHKAFLTFQEEFTVIQKLTKESEVFCYQAIFNENPVTDFEKDAVKLKPFVPQFLSVREGRPEGLEEKMPDIKDYYSHTIKISNETFGYISPSILDIKLGKLCSHPNSITDKEREKDAGCLTAEYGWRVTGHQIRDGDSNVVDESYKKYTGMTYDQAKDIFRAFLGGDEEDKESLIAELQKIHDAYATMTSLMSFGPSILVIRENHDKHIKVAVKVIDLTYIQPLEEGLDKKTVLENVPNAVTSLISAFRDL